MTSGPTARPLIATLASGDPSILDLLPQLRAALNGSGPALRLHGRNAPPPPSVPLTPADDDPQDPTALAVTTSGSSGAAKTVLLTASALLASAGATHDRLGGSGHWLLALPAEHVAGLQVLVRSLIAGTTPVVLDLNSGFTAEGFIEAVGRLRGGRRYTALVPTQLTRLLSAGRPGVEALRRFDAILIGGAATPPALREQAEAAGVRLVTTYGMSETCGGCVYDGVPLDGMSVRILEPGDDESGRVTLGGPMVTRGYLGSAEARATVHDHEQESGRDHARLHDESPFSTDDTGQRWFRTDDAGSFADGRLRILGRLDSVIITGGVNVAPALVEAALARLPGVAEVVVVGLPDPEWGQRVAAALVLEPGATAPTLAEARALVGREVSGPAAPRQLTVLDALPLRGPGKPDRTAITKALLEQSPREGN